VFIDTYWPDFDEASFAAALGEFARRGAPLRRPVDRPAAELLAG